MGKQVVLAYDATLYDPEALQKAAYRGLEAFTANIFRDGKGQFQCVLEPNPGIGGEAFNAAVLNFKKDVLDYQLRLKLKVETEPVRNLILGIAFSRTGLRGGE